MVRIDSSTVLIIGGFQNGSNSNKVWEVDLSNNFTIKEGPSLNVSRNGHSCAKMILNGKLIIVVAGGNDGKSCLDSVELLDPHSKDGWILGKYRKSKKGGIYKRRTHIFEHFLPLPSPC